MILSPVDCSEKMSPYEGDIDEERFEVLASFVHIHLVVAWHGPPQ